MKTQPIAAGILLAAINVLIVAGPARADYAVLRSGGRLHISGYALESDHVRLTVAGGSVLIAADELISIEPEEVFPLPPPQDVDFGVRYAKLIRASALKHGVEAKLIASVIEAESSFDAKAVSRKNALGLMQLLPTTAARYLVTNIFDPAQNIDAGTHYLRDLIDRYHGNLTFALAAYNAGPEVVDHYGGVPPFAETQNYVRHIASELASALN